jgi:D-alanine-D-alanine ligase
MSGVGKRRVAVMFGGRSPEHDISVVTALQAMDALDSSRFEVIPVYVTIHGLWLTGPALRTHANYLPKPGMDGVTPVALDMVPGHGPRLLPTTRGWMGMARPIAFDVALPAFHGLVGEDGCIQGLLETADVPYTGMRLPASNVFMDKVLTKHLMAAAGVPVLPYREVRRPAQGTYVKEAELRGILKGFKGPWCVKPSHLGSSIGVGKAETIAEVAALLPGIFAYDSVAIIEPFVANMVEYNVAVKRDGRGKVVTSAIERPKRVADLLDFKEKYLTGGGKKGGKMPGTSSEGMLSMTRDINPRLPAKAEADIRAWAEKAYEAAYGSGLPRIDFISNGKTGQVWLNEVNPLPGSFGFFLWEASARHHRLFSTLLSEMIDEALALHARGKLPADPVPEAARVLKRP